MKGVKSKMSHINKEQTKRSTITLTIKPEIKEMLIEQSEIANMSASRYVESIITDMAYKAGWSFQDEILQKMKNERKK